MKKPKNVFQYSENTQQITCHRKGGYFQAIEAIDSPFWVLKTFMNQ